MLHLGATVIVMVPPFRSYFVLAVVVYLSWRQKPRSMPFAKRYAWSSCIITGCFSPKCRVCKGPRNYRFAMHDSGGRDGAISIFPTMTIARGVGLWVAIGFGLPLLVLLVQRRIPAVAAWLRALLAWRNHDDRPTDIARAAAFHTELPSALLLDALDNRTWQDLDLDEVFCSLDHTESEPGRQYLYHILRMPQHTAAPLERRERVLSRLANDAALADQIRVPLRRLEHPRAGQLVHLVLGALPARPYYWLLFPMLTATSSVSLVLFLTIWPPAFVIWLGVCLLNLWVQLFYRPRVKRFVPAIRELPAFIGVGLAMGALDIAEAQEETTKLRDASRKLGGLRRAAMWLIFEPGEGNEFAASAYEYINLVFLLDVNAFVFTIEKLRASQRPMQEVFEGIGYLDAMQSVSRWRASLPFWSTPRFVPAGKMLDVEALYHPLLSNPVPNSLDVEDASVLITGSNMSGKTTFVRALGVNAILAQTLNSVCAERWRVPMMRVRTSIGRSDSIIEGKSYYLAEVESVAALVKAKSDNAQYLFLLDEIFRGTNTTERVAAGFAVLSYLDRGSDIVVVATHDIEMIDLLGERYATRHFRETVTDGQMIFDYRIHDGPSSSRNAIALLEVVQLPADLVAEAVATLDWQRRDRTAPAALNK